MLHSIWRQTNTALVYVICLCIYAGLATSQSAWWSWHWSLINQRQILQGWQWLERVTVPWVTSTFLHRCKKVLWVLLIKSGQHNGNILSRFWRPCFNLFPLMPIFQMTSRWFSQWKQTASPSKLSRLLDDNPSSCWLLRWRLKKAILFSMISHSIHLFQQHLYKNILFLKFESGRVLWEVWISAKLC
jgi:hypothetical protein